MTNRSIPTNIVPIRYAVAYADSTTSMDFGTDRAELITFLAERAVVRGTAADLPNRADVLVPAGQGYWAADRRAYAEAVVVEAERDGNAYAFEWDVPAVVTAWQQPVYQGEADDLAAWEAAQDAHEHRPSAVVTDGAVTCRECGAWLRWAAEPLTVAEQGRVREAVAAVADSLDGKVLPDGNARAAALQDAARAAVAALPADATDDDREAAWSDAWEAALAAAVRPAAPRAAAAPARRTPAASRDAELAASPFPLGRL